MEAEKSSENHFSLIKKYHACKMLSNYAGMKIRNENNIFKRTAAKCAKLKNEFATRAKLLLVIVKYANLRRSRLPSRPGYLSSFKLFPHGLPLRVESSLNKL